MSGILEGLIAKLDNLETKINLIAQHLGKTRSDEQPCIVSAVVEQATTTVSPATVDVSVSEQKTESLVNKFGVPWHPDHHSTTQKQNNDGSWKIKKGADKDAVAAYEAQYKNGGSIVVDTSNAPAVPSVPVTVVPETPAVPTVPETPAVPVPPVPETPVVPVTPSAPVSSSAKNRAISLIQALVKDHNVPYPLIIDGLLSKHGVATFDTLPDDKCDQATDDADKWWKALNTIDECIETLDTINEATDKAHQLPTHVFNIIKAAGVDKHSNLPFDKVFDVEAKLVGFANSWSTWYEANKKA